MTPATQTTELNLFHQFVTDRLDRGERLSLEEAIAQFREECPDAQELSESIPALRRALDQADRGEGIPLDEAIRRLRDEFDLPRVAGE